MKMKEDLTMTNKQMLVAQLRKEQEQIEKMARSMCGYCSTDGKCAVSKNGREPDICANVDTQHCLYKEYAERLIESGYGDVSEYKAEIERLQDKCEELRNEKWDAQDDLDCYCDEMPNKIKQAKIDVLNELKTRHDYAIKNMGYPWDISQQIDELIEEVENDKRRD